MANPVQKVLTRYQLKQQNEHVVAQLRQTGLFRTNEDVVDQALRVLVAKLQTELNMLPEGKPPSSQAETSGDSLDEATKQRLVREALQTTQGEAPQSTQDASGGATGTLGPEAATKRL